MPRSRAHLLPNTSKTRADLHGFARYSTDAAPLSSAAGSSLSVPSSKVHVCTQTTAFGHSSRSQPPDTTHSLLSRPPNNRSPPNASAASSYGVISGVYTHVFGHSTRYPTRPNKQPMLRRCPSPALPARRHLQRGCTAGSTNQPFPSSGFRGQNRGTTLSLIYGAGPGSTRVVTSRQLMGFRRSTKPRRCVRLVPTSMTSHSSAASMSTCEPAR